MAKILESGRTLHGDRWGLEEGSQGGEEVGGGHFCVLVYFRKTGGAERVQGPSPVDSPALHGPQLPLSMHQTTVLIRLGLALGFAEGWLAVPGGPEACRGPWGEVGGRGECGVWGDGGGRGG